MLRTQRLASNNFSLLVAAAILHVLTTTSIYLTGRFQFARGIVDANGIGLLSSSDCIPYRLQTIALVEALTHEGAWAWLNMSAPFHIKLYSLVFSVSRYFFGFTILGAEPINLLLYLVIIVLVFKIAREAFDRRTALLAAATVAVWPSFLLHTTQFLKEPLFIAGMLALVSGTL
jgi:hypothetical protein